MKIKTLVTISLLIFLLVSGAIIIIGLMQTPNKIQQDVYEKNNAIVLREDSYVNITPVDLNTKTNVPVKTQPTQPVQQPTLPPRTTRAS
jgi:hypothetical protein